MLKRLFILLAASVLSANLFANPPINAGQDNPNVNLAQAGGMPPGLQGKTVPGLQKGNKTPPGWSHGKKKGWYKDKHGKWRKVKHVKVKPFDND